MSDSSKGFSLHDTLTYLVDSFIASDPGQMRFRNGARAFLTAGLSAAALTLIAHLLHLNPMVSMIGVLVPLMTTIAVQDPGRPQQMVTMALVPVVASIVVAIGSAASSSFWMNRLLFLAAIFIAFELRRFGPRGAALGMITYFSYFFSVFLKVSFDKVQWLALFILAGSAIAFAVRFWLVPEHPVRVLASQLRAYRAGMSALLYQLARHAGGQGGAGSRKRLRARMADLNDLSLQIEQQLVQFESGQARSACDELRGRVLRCEIAAESLVAAARTAAAREDEQGTADDRRQRLLRLLRALRASVREGVPFDHQALERAAGSAGLPFSDELHWRFYWAARVLADEGSWSFPLPALPERPAVSPAGKHRLLALPAWLSLDDNRRQAIRATVAALGAMIAGHAIAPSRWYWAVIAAFVVFTRAMTIGQALSRAWQRVLGTALGVLLGLVVADLVRGDFRVELALLFAFVALGYYLFRASYTAFVLLFTTMLALLYELIGLYSEGVLWVRMEETLAGALSAALAAALVLPIRTSTVAERNTADLLREAARLLRELFAADGAKSGQRPLREAVRGLDRRMQTVRQSLAPVTSSIFPAPKEGRRQLLHRLAVLVYCIRHLYAFTLDHPPDAGQLRGYREMVEPLAGNIDALVAALEHPGEARGDGRLAEMPKRFPFPQAAARQGYRAAESERIATDWLWQAHEVVAAMYARARR